MGEFLVRWCGAGLVVWGGLLGLAESGFPALASTGTSGLPAALWIGFVNALVRPAVMEICGLRVRGAGLFGCLFGMLAGVNFFLLHFLETWEPACAAVPWGLRVFLALGLTGVSGTLSSVFRARDGRWRWITYHGTGDEKHEPRRSGKASRGGGG